MRRDNPDSLAVQPKSLRLSFTRERMIGLIIALIVFFTLLILGLRWFEHAVSFHPERYDGGDSWKLPTRARDVWLTTSDGVRLHGWFFDNEKPGLATIIYFHGNGGNLSYVGWLGERLSAREFEVLLIDYRGYGRSNGYVSDEAGLYADGDAGYDYVTGILGTDPKRVVLYGQSLGTAIAADLAARRECGAVILESGFSSSSDLASTLFPWFPSQLHFLTKNKFETSRKLSQAKCPVLITHGDPDETIPLDQAHLLHAAAKEPKKLLIFPGAGHNVFGSQGDFYEDVIVDFLSTTIERNR